MHLRTCLMSLCHDVIVTIRVSLTQFFGNSINPARPRRTVVFDARKLGHRGSEITARKICPNSCSKSPQIERRNLELREKCSTFAVLKMKNEE